MTSNGQLWFAWDMLVISMAATCIAIAAFNAVGVLREIRDELRWMNEPEGEPGNDAGSVGCGEEEMK